tara:strand:- start:523 stop:1221 length:699 start_codon:yes stop_codon:yes gene_type:complete
MKLSIIFHGGIMPRIYYLYPLLFMVLLPWIYFDTKTDLSKAFEAIELLKNNQVILTNNQQALSEKFVEDNYQENYEHNDGSAFFDYEPEPVSWIQIIDTNKKIKYERLDIFCLAKNIYHEAGVENKKGKYAVAQVTLNRVKHRSYPSTICHVVMDPYQFSWANNRKIRWKHPRGKNWEVSKRIAEDVILNGKRLNGFDKALFYHADYVSPNWKKPSAKIAKIGSHIFYTSAR